MKKKKKAAKKEVEAVAKKKSSSGLRDGSMIRKIYKALLSGPKKFRELQKLGKADVHNRVYQLKAYGAKNGRWSVKIDGETVKLFKKEKGGKSAATQEKKAA